MLGIQSIKSLFSRKEKTSGSFNNETQTEKEKEILNEEQMGFQKETNNETDNEIRINDQIKFQPETDKPTETEIETEIPHMAPACDLDDTEDSIGATVISTLVTGFLSLPTYGQVVVVGVVGFAAYKTGRYVYSQLNSSKTNMFPTRRLQQQKKLWMSLGWPFSATSCSHRVDTANLRK